MPLYCSNTGSTALRDAEVQQPITDAHLSLTSSFFAFSAKVGQSLAPSSWMNLILRPSTPPCWLVCSIASFSASTEPVSLIAMVPVTECRMPTVTSLSVTASPVVFTLAVGNCWARACGDSIAVAEKAAAPARSSRRVGFAKSVVHFLDVMRRLFAAGLPAGQASRARFLGRRLRCFAALQHTSIDVYAYVGCRSKMPMDTGNYGQCGRNEEAALFAFFCTAHCLVFRHMRTPSWR